MNTLEIGNKVIVVSPTSLDRGKCGTVVAVDSRANVAKIQFGSRIRTYPTRSLEIRNERTSK